jgi:Rieske 2Fe-2S family protein
VAIDRLAAWPLSGLAVGHVLTKTVRCNWKIFWENYNECLHCPGVHPQLSQLVPIFGRGLLEERDDPHWREHADDPDPKFKGGLRGGAETWSLDGKTTGRTFPGLADADRKAGAIYMTGLPSIFLVGHIDYVRVVRLLPLGPELCELRVEYLFSSETLADPAFDLNNVVVFTNLVMTEDAEVCELNQSGLRAAPHARGVVMPEEYVIRQLHEWLRTELSRV